MIHTLPYVHTIGERRYLCAWLTVAQLVDDADRVATFAQYEQCRPTCRECFTYLEKKVAEAITIHPASKDSQIADYGWHPAGPYFWSAGETEMAMTTRDKWQRAVEKMAAFCPINQ